MSLVDEQIAIENNAHYEAKARYDKYKMKSDDGFVRNPVSNNLLASIVPRYALMLEEWWNSETQGGDPKARALRKYFRDIKLDAVSVSVATLRVLFTTLFRDKLTSNTDLASKVYAAVHLEESYKEFQDYGKNKDLTESERRGWQMLSKKVLKDSKDKHMHNRIKVLKYARDTFTDLAEEDPVEKVRKGLALLRIALQLTVVIKKGDEPTRLFLMKNVKRYKKDMNVTVFTDKIRKYLVQKEQQISAALLSYYPMVIPPTPWESMFGGGYATPRGRGNIPLIKSPNAFKIKDEEIGEHIYKAVNTIQATPWKINKKVFAVMDYCVQNGIEIGSLPVKAREHIMPERKTPEEWAELSYEQRKEIIDTRKSLHREADSEHSKVLSLKLKLSMARRFLRYEKIYYPHTYDFRGRIYPIAAAVNPQSDKFGQALLEFGEKEPLGETGEKWLAIHGANSWGLDGESFDKRLQWIEENGENISTTAENPLGTRKWWGEAEDPFGFLAFCFEWAEMLKCGDKSNFLTSLPVKLDATSSGLQHYSMIFRDEVGAKATNLMDGERSDIYKLVAEATKRILSEEIEKEKDPEEAVWKRSFLKVMNRSICKPATMCLPYGISMFGATDALIELYRDGKFEGAYVGKDKGNAELTRRLRYIAEKIMEGVGQVVKSAIVGMDWLKKVEKEALKDNRGKPMKYTTRLGFPFYQQYYKSNKKRVKMFLGDVNIRLNIRSFTKEVDARKSNSAIAPNFIHSQDATHLLKCALMGKDLGISSFSFIHDSFGVHAGRTETFRNVIREAFVWLYTEDTFKRAQNAWEQQYNKELSEPPYESYGSFDIKECLKSSYMFN